MDYKRSTWLISFISILVSFVIMEVTLRIFLPQPTYSDLLLMTGEQYVKGDFIPFNLKKNYRAMMPSMDEFGEFVEISTNSLGLRGKEITIEKPVSTKRVLVLGDSYTFGVYCNNEEIYPQRLESLCRQGTNNEIEVINAGYADGWGPDEHYVWLAKKGLEFSPDIVVYGFFVGNDIADIEASTWLETDAKGLPTRIKDPTISIDQFGRIRSKEKDSKTIGYELVYRIPLMRESHLLIFCNKAFLKIARMLNHKDSINNDWGDKPFEPILSSEPTQEMRKKEQIFLKLVDGMRSIANQNGAEFLLIMIPINFQVEPEEFLSKVVGSSKFRIQRDFYSELESKLAQMHIEYINLLPIMRAHSEQKFYPRNGEVHLNSKGHDFVAKEIQQKLLRLGWLSDFKELTN